MLRVLRVLFLRKYSNLFSQKLRVLRVWTNIDKVYPRVPYLEYASLLSTLFVILQDRRVFEASRE